jgi:WD40 repeat protein
MTASQDGTAQLWDTTSGQLLGEPLRHDASIQCAEFSGDGAQVVTASLDGTARVWDGGPTSDSLPAWFPDFAESIGGLKFAGGATEATGAPTDRASVPDGGNDCWMRLARWLLLPAEDRPAYPIAPHP